MKNWNKNELKADNYEQLKKLLALYDSNIQLKKQLKQIKELDKVYV